MATERTKAELEERLKVLEDELSWYQARHFRNNSYARLYAERLRKEAAVLRGKPLRAYRKNPFGEKTEA